MFVFSIFVCVIFCPFVNRIGSLWTWGLRKCHFNQAFYFFPQFFFKTWGYHSCSNWLTRWRFEAHNAWAHAEWSAWLNQAKRLSGWYSAVQLLYVTGVLLRHFPKITIKQQQSFGDCRSRTEPTVWIYMDKMAHFFYYTANT